MRIPLVRAKNSRIPKLVNLCKEDERLYTDYINPAQERLLNAGRWWGTYQVAQFCVTNGCLVWPREVATIEQVAVCGTPIEIRNQWYQFVQDLGHIQSCDSCSSGRGSCRRHFAMESHGTTPTFADIIPSGKKIRIYPTHASDVGKRVLLQGYDDNKIWIRNTDAGEWVDGEYVTLAMPYVDTVSNFSSLTGGQKDPTNSRLLVYELTVSTGAERSIAIWQPDEEYPQYQKSLIPGLSSIQNDCDDTVKVTAMVSLAFIPAEKDTDWLIIGNIPALEFMCKAIKLEEDNFEAEAVLNEKKAIRELQKELRKMTGDRTVINIRTQGTAHLERVFGGFN